VLLDALAPVRPRFFSKPTFSREKCLLVRQIEIVVKGTEAGFEHGFIERTSKKRFQRDVGSYTTILFCQRIFKLRFSLTLRNKKLPRCDSDADGRRDRSNGLHYLKNSHCTMSCSVRAG